MRVSPDTDAALCQSFSQAGIWSCSKIRSIVTLRIIMSSVRLMREMLLLFFSLLKGEMLLS